MPIKPIDIEDDNEYYDEGLRTSSMIKSFVLITIIAFGMFFGFYYDQNKKDISQQMYKAGIRPTTAPTMEPFKPVAAYNPDVDTTLNALKDESSNAIGSGVAQLLGAGTDVLGSATQNVTKNVSTNVQKTAADTTQNFANTMYKGTLGQVIQQLFNQLPPATKKEVVKELIKQITPTPKPTLEP